MKKPYILLILLILLVASMYYWINVKSGIEKIISMLVLVIVAYWLGRFHGKLIGESNIVRNYQSN